MFRDNYTQVVVQLVHKNTIVTEVAYYGISDTVHTKSLADHVDSGLRMSEITMFT